MSLTKIRSKRAMPEVRGFSLIEVLVAVLILGVGVLGVTGLQVVSLQNNRAALMRADATMLAYDMMDRVRANPSGAPRGAAYSGVDIGDEPPAAGNCVGSTCTAGQMVNFDQAAWKCQLGAYEEHSVCTGLRDDDLLPPLVDQPGLPDGDGSIAVNAAGLVSVTVQWTGLNGELQTIAIDSQS